MRIVDWDSIDTVLLDMDGTLLDLHYDNYFWQEHVPLRYAEQNQLSLIDARAYLSELITGQRGTLNWYCLDYWSKVLELDVTALKSEVADRISVLPGVHPFLTEASKSSKRVVLVTNAHQGGLDLKMERTELSEYLDEIYCSHDFGKPKEDRTFWEALRQIEPFEPERTLLVDDNSSVLDSARDYGIRYSITIAQPDRQKPPREGLKYPAIASFTELLPIV